MLARRAVGTGPAQLQIRQSEIPRPVCRDVLRLRMRRLDVIIVRLDFTPGVGREQILRQPDDHFGSAAASSRMKVADTFPLPFDNHPYGAWQRLALGFCDLFSMEKIGA